LTRRFDGIIAGRAVSFMTADDFADKVFCRADGLVNVRPNPHRPSTVPGPDKEIPLVSDMHEAEYEEISSDEVDNVIAALERLSDEVSSETIKALIAECSNSVYYLVYEDDESSMSEAA
jgi:hypothetical protein